MNRKTRKSLPHEIAMQDRNDVQSKNIVNYDVNNTIQIKYSIEHYYQKKEDANFVLTNKKKSWVHFFGIEFTNIL